MSLFDFDGFDPEAYSAKYPLSSWREFVPCRPEFEAAIWIEIDRAKIVAGFISGEELLAKWNHENKQCHVVMPLIEAAHIGPIPLSSTTRTITLPKRKVEHDPIAERLRAGRDRLVLRGWRC